MKISPRNCVLSINITNLAGTEKQKVKPGTQLGQGAVCLRREKFTAFVSTPFPRWIFKRRGDREGQVMEYVGYKTTPRDCHA